MSRFKDLSGKRFGRLVALEIAEKTEDKGKGGVYWKFLCDCGNEKIVSSTLLSNGRTKSCGCLNLERINNLKSHGMSRDKNHKHTNLYGRWANIKDRCCNPNCKDYEKYGGRGITICDDWMNNFSLFYNWAISNGYIEGLQIDRKDNSKGYSPDNCHWVSAKENSNNRRNSIKINIFGSEKTISELSENVNIPYQTLWRHYNIGDIEDYIIKRTGKALEKLELQDKESEGNEKNSSSFNML